MLVIKRTETMILALKIADELGLENNTAFIRIQMQYGRAQLTVIAYIIKHFYNNKSTLCNNPN